MRLTSFSNSLIRHFDKVVSTLDALDQSGLIFTQVLFFQKVKRRSVNVVIGIGQAFLLQMVDQELEVCNPAPVLTRFVIAKVHHLILLSFQLHPIARKILREP